MKTSIDISGSLGLWLCDQFSRAAVVNNWGDYTVGWGMNYAMPSRGIARSATRPRSRDDPVEVLRARFEKTCIQRPSCALPRGPGAVRGVAICRGCSYVGGKS